MDVQDVQSAHLGNFRDSGNIVFRVSDALDIDRFRLVINSLFELPGVIPMDKLDPDSIFLERDCGPSLHKSTPCMDGRHRPLNWLYV